LPQSRPILDGVPASTLQLPQGAHVSVLDGLCAYFPAVARDVWLQRMARGRVLDVRHQAVDPDTPYLAGQTIHYFREVEDEPVIPFEETIIHADEHLVVADKPHFLPVAPTGAYVRQTLLTRLIQRLDNPDLVPLHRIDRGTAGLVLFSANPETRGAYQSLFRDRRIDKQYLAVARALPGLREPLLRESRLERGEPFFRMAEMEGMPNSASRIEMTQDQRRGWALYRLRPLTGRKHQLRVHMAALGAPVLNDQTYPLLQPQSHDDYTRPLQLLAHSLSFIDPIHGGPRRFASERQLVLPEGITPG
jgi:tRNA pseudouridine32 synthase/23S rRNA pseudouridine746 synthase